VNLHFAFVVSRSGFLYQRRITESILILVIPASVAPGLHAIGRNLSRMNNVAKRLSGCLVAEETGSHSLRPQLKIERGEACALE